MRHIIFAVLVPSLLIACQSYAPKPPAQPMSTVKQHTVEGGVLIMSYRSGHKAQALDAIARLKGQLIYDYQNLDMLAARFDPNTLEQTQRQLKQSAAILSVEPDQEVSIQPVQPNHVAF